MSKIVELSHRLHSGMPTYPGDRPSPKIETIVKNGISLSSIRLGSHMGTHMDAPRHFFAEGKALGEISPDLFVGKALCLDKSDTNKEIEFSVFDVELVKRHNPDWVLLYTGHDRLWKTESYFSRHPFPSKALIQTLVKMNMSGIGVDFPSIDAAEAEKDDYPAHHLWLGAGRLAIENLRGLQQLPMGKTIDFYALPLNIDADGAPVRVLAKLPA